MRTFPILAAASAALGVAGAAGAADKKPDVPAVAADLLRCRGEADDAARLRCYDAAAATLAAGVDKGEVVVLDRETIRKTRNSLFGFSINLPDFGGKSGPEPKEVVEAVKSIRAPAQGLWQIQLESGALWQTTELTPTLMPPRVGEKVKIRKGIAGGYMLHLGPRLVRIRRVG
jgi:hypothetical protein